MRLLNVEDFCRKLTPIQTPELFSATGDFHEQGLFSESIFGVLESKDRRETFSYINLNCDIVHPAIVKILYRLDRKILKLISGEQMYSIDKDGFLIEDDDNGFVGIYNFVKNFDRIKVRGETEAREKLIKVVQESYKRGVLFVDKVPVIPPSFRDAFKDNDGNWSVDPLNDYYTAIIRSANQVKSIGKGSPIYDLLNYSVQKAVDNHDDYIRSKLGKKQGLIRQQLMSKRVDFSGRSVITPGPDLNIGEIGLPMRMAVVLFEPFIIHVITRRISDQQKDTLNKHCLDFLNQELSIDSIRKIITAIKNGDEIPEDLYEFFFTVTEMAIGDRYVMAKRDPVLHPESWRSYKPVLIRGNTLQMCTLQLGGHNADFDGDSVDCYVNIKQNDIIEKVNMSDITNKYEFYLEDKKEENGKTITKFKPVKDIEIMAINKEDNSIAFKPISEYSVHENLEMYKISDSKNRFDIFWASDDHSLLVYDEKLNKIIEISPTELINNSEGRYLIQNVTN